MQRLIDRQTALLRHMTSPTFIFGTEDLESVARDPDLKDMDIRRLRLEAEFSYNKRMTKIRQTFQRTAALLSHEFSAITRDYASTHPPETYRRYPDAKSFFEYFLETWANKPTTPAWTADVAAVELALSRARTLRPMDMEGKAVAECPNEPRTSWYRAHPCALLVCCTYDVRPLFETARSGEAIMQGPAHVAVLASRGRRRPLVMEVAPEAFALMERSTEWTMLDPESNSTAGLDKTLIEHLAGQGLMLVRSNDAHDGTQG